MSTGLQILECSLMMSSGSQLQNLQVTHPHLPTTVTINTLCQERTTLVALEHRSLKMSFFALDKQMKNSSILAWLSLQPSVADNFVIGLAHVYACHGLDSVKAPTSTPPVNKRSLSSFSSHY